MVRARPPGGSGSGGEDVIADEEEQVREAQRQARDDSTDDTIEPDDTTGRQLDQETQAVRDAQRGQPDTADTRLSSDPIAEGDDAFTQAEVSSPDAQPASEVYESDSRGDTVVLPEDDRDRLTRRTAASSQLIDREDIRGFRETSEGYRPLLTAEAKGKLARQETAEQLEGITTDDIKGFRDTPAGPVAVFNAQALSAQPLDPAGGGGGRELAGLRETAASELPGVDASDIRGFQQTESGGLQPLLTADAQRERVRESLAAQDPRIDESDIQRIEQTDDGQFSPVLTGAARRELVAAGNPQLDESDIARVERTASGEYEPVLTTEAREELVVDRIASENPTIDEDDIVDVRRTAGGEYRPVLTDDARLAQANASFEIERDPQRLFAGTERVPLYLDESDFELRMVDGEVRAELTEAAQAEVRRREARAAAPFVSEFGDLNPAEEFLTEAQAEQFEPAERGETSLANAPVPGRDENLVETLESGSEFYREGGEVFDTGVRYPGVEGLSSAAGEFGASPAGAAGDLLVLNPSTPEERRRRAETAVTGAGTVFDFSGIGADILRLGQRIDAVQGDPEAGKRLGREAVLLSARGTEFALENPQRAAGGFAGGAVASVGAGRAIARSGSVAREANIRARGGRVYQFDELSNPPAETGSGLPGFTRRAQRDPNVARREFREQAESTALADRPARVTSDLRVDPTSGPLQVSDELKAALEQTVRRPGRRATDLGRAARETPGRAATAVDQAAFRAGVRAGEFTRQLEAGVGRAARGARQLPGNVRQAAVEFPGEARATATRIGRGARQRGREAAAVIADAPLRARARARQLGRRYDQRVFEAGRRTGERIGAVEDYYRSQVRRVDQAAFRAGERTGEAITTIEQLPGRLQTRAGAAGDRLDQAAFRAGERTGEAITTIERTPGRARTSVEDFGATLDDVAFRAGERTGDAITSIEQLPGQARARVGEVGAAYDARVESLGVRTGRAISQGEERLAAISDQLDATAFEAGRRTGQAIETLEDIPDLTLEVGYQPAQSRTVAMHARDPASVRQYGGFGQRFEAPGGESELEGLFQSADLSRLRFDDVGESGGVNLGIARPNVYSTRVLAEEDVELGITRGQTRREVGEFLEEDASRQRSYIRTDSGGGPTPEQEAIAPPGSTFEATGELFGVRVGGTRIPFTDRRIGGEVVPGRMTRRVDADTSNLPDPELGGDAELFTEQQAARETTEAISRARSRQSDLTIEPQPLAAQSTDTNQPGEFEESLRSTVEPEEPRRGSTLPRESRRGRSAPGASTIATTTPTRDAVSSASSPTAGISSFETPTSGDTATSRPTTVTETRGVSSPGESMAPAGYSPPSLGYGQEPVEVGFGVTTTPPVVNLPEDVTGTVPSRTSGRQDRDRDQTPYFGGSREPDFTDFRNPLSGELLETQPAFGETFNVGSDLDEPELLGFLDE